MNTTQQAHTSWQTIRANLPYVAMLLLGAATIACAFPGSAWGKGGGAAYMAYGVAGVIWIMIFVCPFCACYDTRACLCGYGVIAAKLVRNGAQGCFSEKFRRHIPAIVPLWLISVVCGGFALWRGFSWPLVWLMAVFVVNSYMILPLVS